MLRATEIFLKSRVGRHFSEQTMDERRKREANTETAKTAGFRPMHPKVLPLKKVQAVYYLSRNGQLEHPHYMEVVHVADQPLRLKDFTDRLTVLRGSGMPGMYSWSCKRGYKNGYVWNDLAENDVVSPSHGGEYVLKGSELLERAVHHGKPHIQFSPREGDEEEQEILELEDEEKTSYTSSTTASHCSRGVSTDEKDDECRKLDGVEKPGRSSVLLQLIACGNMTVNRVKASVPSSVSAAARKSSVCEGETSQRRPTGDRADDYVAESARFAKLQAADKEYFSGSIVEAMNSDAREPCLQKSNSYGEQRSSREEDDDSKDIKGKCIPRKIVSMRR